MYKAPYLLVGVDTEGDNLWDLSSRATPTFENIYQLPRLHAMFRRHGVRPTYFTTYPVAGEPRSADVLRRLQAEGTCEIGAHHHAWETPPCSLDDVRALRYALALPLEQFDRQLQALTESIANAVGVRPTSYRSGRLGFSGQHVSPLERSGYEVESSVVPLFYEAHKGGPDFVDAPVRPYFLAYDSATRPGSSRVLEIPVSAGLDRPMPALLQRWYGRAPYPYTTKRALRLLHLIQLVWLRPSYSSFEQMAALATRLVGDGVPVLNLLFHSSEAIVGGSPYNRTDTELQAFLEKLERFLAFARRDLNLTPVTFSEYRSEYCTSATESGRAPDPPPVPGGVSSQAHSAT